MNLPTKKGNEKLNLGDSEGVCWVPKPLLERLLMGQSKGKLGSFLTRVTPIYLPVHPRNSAGWI